MHTVAAPADETRFLRLPDVKLRVGLGKSKIYDMVVNGEFPRPVKIGRASVWPESQISAWQKDKMGK